MSLTIENSQIGKMEAHQPDTAEILLILSLCPLHKSFVVLRNRWRCVCGSPRFASCLAVFFLVQVLISFDAEAQTILGFNVNGVADSSSTAALLATTITGNLSTATGLNSLTRASGLTAGSGAAMFNSTSWNTTNIFNESDDYISFSMQAQSGFEATYSSISYVLGATSTAPNTALWGYKIGSGSFVLQSSFTVQNSTSIARASWDFSDFTTTQVVEFRFWVYGATSTSGGSSASGGTVRLRDLSTPTVNDLYLDGSLQSVPEPSTWALIGIATAFFLHRLRGNRSISSR